MPRTRLSCLEACGLAVCLLVLQPAAQAAMTLQCTLSAPARVRVGEPVLLDWQFTNTGTLPLAFLAWGTPFEGGWFAPYAQVLRNGQPLSYSGALIKRGDPGASDYRLLPPGGSLTARIELGLAFDLRSPGHYRVQPTLRLHDLLQGDTAVLPRPLAALQPATPVCPAVEFDLVR